MNLYDAIRCRNSQNPSRVVLREGAGGKVLSWDAFDARIAQFACVLSRHGLSKGDRVAVQVEKTSDALVLYLACLRAGLIFLPMNTAYMADEVAYLVGNAEPGLVVGDESNATMLAPIAQRHGARYLTLAEIASLAGDEAPDFATLPCDPDDIACILYTSGTTGKPKGAMLSHGNLAANALALVEAWGFSQADVLVHALPIFHAHGLFVACHCALFSGAEMIWLESFDVERVTALLPGASVFMGVPTYYTRLLAHDGFTAETCRAMRLFVSGSAPLLAETFRAFKQRTGHEVLERYGMTETGMNCSNPLNGERRPGTVGPPLPGVSARLGGGGGGGGETGILEVKGANVFKGYWRNAEKTREDFTTDGWFITGDLARIDNDGYIHLVGRAKDLIISGGFNVYPKEVEEVIDSLDGVVESAVVAMPHPDFGEAVAAFVVRGREGLDEAAVIAQTKRRIANYKVPKLVRFLPELPRNTMGKVQKTQLRALLDGKI